MKITMKDVAKRAGVSVPTVSLIVNGRDLSFKESTRQAVREAIEALNYRPDSMARRNAAGAARRDVVAMLLRSESTSRVANSPSYEFICGVNDVMMERNQLLIFVKLAHLQADEDAGPQPRVISENFVDGLIVEAGLPAPLVAAVKRYRIPTVWLNTDRHDETDCVYPDEQHAGRIVTEHLIGLGHQRIVYLSASAPDEDAAHFSVRARRRGYEQAMRSAKLPALVRREELKSEGPGGLTSVDVSATVRAVVESRRTPAPITAVVTYELIQAVRMRDDLRAAGLACPAEVSVAAAEDLRFLRRVWPEVTGVTCDRYKMGRLAAELMLAKLAAPTRPHASHAPLGQLIRGTSTAAISPPIAIS